MKKSYIATVNKTANGSMYVENLINFGEKKTYNYLSFDELEEYDKHAFTVCMVGERTKLRYVYNLIYVAIYNLDGSVNGFSNVDAFEYVNDIESFMLRGAERKDNNDDK